MYLNVRRFLKRTAIIVLSLILLLVAVVLFWLGPTVKLVVEGVGSKALGTPIRIESLVIRPLKGTLDLRVLEIETHDGFNRTNTWDMGELALSMNLRSLFSDTIVIHEIRINHPHFTYEHNSETDNITELIKGVREFIHFDPDAPKPVKEKKEKPTKKLIIEQFVVNNALVDAVNTDASQQDVQISLEQFSLSLTNGVVQLKNLSLRNPRPLATTNLFHLAAAEIQLDPATIYSNKIVVKQVQITQPHAFFEENAETDTLAEFQAIVESFAAKKSVPKTKPKKQPKKPAPMVEVHDVQIDDLQLHLVNMTDPKLNLQFRLGTITLNPSAGKMELKELSLSNPGRLKTPNAIELGALRVQIDPASLTSAPVVIEKVEVIKPHAFFEKSLKTDSMTEFMKVVANFIPKKKEQSPKPATSPASTKTSPPVELREVLVDDLQLHYINSGIKENIRFTLGQFELNLVSGKVDFKNLSLSNPRALSLPNLVELGEIKIQVDPASVSSGSVVIQEVKISKPRLLLEQTLETDTVSEITKLIAGLDLSTKAPAEEIEPPPPVVREKSKAPSLPPVQLEKLWVDDIQVQLRNTTQSESNTNLILLARVGEVDVQLAKGKLSVRDISIPNLRGFVATNLFHLSNLDIDIDPKSVYSSPLVVQKVFVDAPLINIEQTETTGNFIELQKMISGFIPQTPELIGPQPEEVVTVKGEPPLLLKTLLVTNLTVNMISPGIINKDLFDRVGNIKPLERIGLKKKEESTEVVVATPENMRLASFDQLVFEPIKGMLLIKHLQLGNPPEFTDKDLVTLDLFRMDFSPSTIQSNIFIIEDILISNPLVAYERKFSTDNIKAFQDFLATAFEKRSSVLEDAPAVAPSNVATKKVVVEHLLVQGGNVRAKISKFPTAPIPLPAIELSGIGKEEGGASVADVASKLYGIFYDAIIGSVAKVMGVGTDALKGAGTLTFGALGTITGGLTDDLGKRLHLDGESKEEKAEKKKGTPPKKSSSN